MFRRSGSDADDIGAPRTLSPSDHLSALQCQRLRAHILDIPAHPHGSLRRQAQARTLQHLGRARRAAQAYRPHLRAAATAALTAAERAFSSTPSLAGACPGSIAAGEGDGAAGTREAPPARSLEEAVSDAAAWKALYQACKARTARLRWLEMEVEKWHDQQEGQARRSSARQGRPQTAAAPTTATATAGPAEAEPGSKRPRLAVKDALKLMCGMQECILAFDPYDIAARLTAMLAPVAAPLPWVVAGSDSPSGHRGGGGSGSSRRGDERGRGLGRGGGAGGAGGGGAGLMPVTMVQALHLESSVAAAMLSADTAGLPGRAALLVRCMVKFWEGVPGARAGAGSERFLDNAAVLAEALVRYHGGPPLMHNEARWLAMLLSELHEDAEKSIDRGPHVDPFAGSRCPLPGALGALCSAPALSRIAQRAAATAAAEPPPPLLPAQRCSPAAPSGRAGATPIGAAPAARAGSAVQVEFGEEAMEAEQSERPLSPDDQLRVAERLAHALINVASRLKPGDPWVRVVEAARDAAEHFDRRFARAVLTSKAPTDKSSAKSRARDGGGGGGGSFEDAEAEATLFMEDLPFLVTARDLIRWLGQSVDSLGGGFSDRGSGASGGGGGGFSGRGSVAGGGTSGSGGGSGGGGGGEARPEPTVLGSGDLGRLAGRTALARVLLDADVGQVTRVTATDGGALLAVLVLLNHLNPARTRLRFLFEEMAVDAAAAAADTAGAGAAESRSRSNATGDSGAAARSAVAAAGGSGGSGSVGGGGGDDGAARAVLSDWSLLGPIVLQPELHTAGAPNGTSCDKEQLQGRCSRPAVHGAAAAGGGGAAGSPPPAVGLTLLPAASSGLLSREDVVVSLGLFDDGDGVPRRWFGPEDEMVTVRGSGAEAEGKHGELQARAERLLDQQRSFYLMPHRGDGLAAVEAALVLLSRVRASLRQRGRDLVVLPLTMEPASFHPEAGRKVLQRLLRRRAGAAAAAANVGDDDKDDDDDDDDGGGGGGFDGIDFGGLGDEEAVLAAVYGELARLAAAPPCPAAAASNERTVLATGELLDAVAHLYRPAVENGHDQDQDQAAGTAAGAGGGGGGGGSSGGGGGAAAATGGNNPDGSFAVFRRARLRSHWRQRRRAAMNKILCDWLGLLGREERWEERLAAVAGAMEEREAGVHGAEDGGAARGRAGRRERGGREYGMGIHVGEQLGRIGLLVLECDPADPGRVL